MTKEEPKLLLIEEGDNRFVALWLQAGMVGQGASPERALRDLLLSIKARKENARDSLLAAVPADEEVFEMFESAAECPADGALKQVCSAIEDEVERLYQPSEKIVRAKGHASLRKADVEHQPSVG